MLPSGFISTDPNVPPPSITPLTARFTSASVGLFLAITHPPSAHTPPAPKSRRRGSGDHEEVRATLAAHLLQEVSFGILEEGFFGSGYFGRSSARYQ
jgi:hypothetical protein